MKQKLFYLIKIASTILITGALGLESWYLFLRLTGGLFPPNFYPALWFGSFALIAHVIEGAIAAIKVKTEDKLAFSYGVYTFFVGFVGLWELSEK